MNEINNQMIVLSRREFWTIKGVIAALIIALICTAVYFHDEYVRHVAYLTNRQEFIEQHTEVQLVLAAETFCYEPRGHILKPAVYKGNNLYKVK